MKIIFLDIDGVLVTQRVLNTPLTVLYIGDQKCHYSALDKECVEWLNKITEATGANIVISSTWRICPTLEWYAVVKYLQENGVKAEILGRTTTELPNVKDKNPVFKTRGAEIQEYIDTHQGIDKFVIIDDDSDMEHLLPYLVRTTWEYGLQEEQAREAINLLTTGTVA